MSPNAKRTGCTEAFVAPARERPEVWRLVLGMLATAAVWLVAVLALPLVAAAAAPLDPGRVLVVAYLASFGAMVLGLWLAVRRLHRRGLATLVGPGGFRPRAFLTGVAVVAAVGALGSLGVLAGPAPERNLAVGPWLAWLPLAVPAVAVQTATEELVFRGYMMQQLAVRFRSRAIWLGVPALLFGVLHWNPVEFGANAWLVVATTVAIGLILGDVTARLGNLSAAMGLHFANNTLAILVLALPSPLAALSLWTVPVDPSDAPAVRGLLLTELAVLGVAYAAWRIWWGRRARLHSGGPDFI